MNKFILVAIFMGGLFIMAQCKSNTDNSQSMSESNSTGTQMDATQMIDNRVEDLTERLSLTSDQIQMVRAIYEKTFGEDAESQATSEQRHSEIMAILNADQKEIYSDYLENRTSPSSRGTQEDGEEASEKPQMDVSSVIDNRVEDLTEKLSLTADQIAKVRAIYEKTLGEDAGSQATSEQRHSEILNILNADQKVIYSSYLEEKENRQGSGERTESE